MDRHVVAIHQPNFLPWLGYFNKIARADTFCLMDNVQFPKKGGTWTNRVQFAVGGSASWVTVPVVRAFSGVRLIREIMIHDTGDWQGKLLKTIQASYARAPHFKEVFPLIERVVGSSAASLADYNEASTRTFCQALELHDVCIVRGSTLGVSGKATELLIEMTRAVGGTTYLCGGGAGGYQEDHKFAEEGMELIYQDFRHPTYPQNKTEDFVPGLSIVDALANCGLEATSKMVKER